MCSRGTDSINAKMRMRSPADRETQLRHECKYKPMKRATPDDLFFVKPALLPHACVLNDTISLGMPWLSSSHGSISCILAAQSLACPYCKTMFSKLAIGAPLKPCLTGPPFFCRGDYSVDCPSDEAQPRDVCQCAVAHQLQWMMLGKRSSRSCPKLS